MVAGHWNLRPWWGSILGSGCRMCGLDSSKYTGPEVKSQMVKGAASHLGKALRGQLLIGGRKFAILCL